MERLTRKFTNGYLFNLPPESDKKAQEEYVDAVSNKLGEYEDLEEQGLLLRLPCKVGDVLWWIDAYGDLRNSEVNSMFVEQGIDGIVIETQICNIATKEIGKTVFLTKEEAESALEKMKGGE